MDQSEEIREGGCACGAVRLHDVAGAPLRAGLCHCMTCRKAHASAANPFLVFAEAQVQIHGRIDQLVQLALLRAPVLQPSAVPGVGRRL